MKDPLEEAGVGADVNSRVATGILLAFIGAMVALAIFVPGSRTPLLLIVGIILMVMLHEFGHYWVAKRSGMKVTEFFVGFGPRLWSFNRGETEYGVKAIPAGGYVRIIGMTNLEEVDPADEPRTFRQATPGKRLATILAGVTVNLIIAFVLFFVVIAGQGRVFDGPNTTVERVQTGSAAHAALLQTNDKIVAIDGKPVHTWDDLKSIIEHNGGHQIGIVVLRHGEQVTLTATPDTKDGKGFLGVGPGTVVRDVGVLEAVPESFKTMGTVFTGFTNILSDRLSPSGVSTSASQSFTSAKPQAGSSEDLNRPMSLIGIVNNGSDLVGSNLWLMALLLAQISFILAVFNLLPILPFDGGHAVVVIYEWIASKVKHRRIYADYRKLIPISVVLIIPILFLGLSSMVLDIRQLGQ
ncbi:MAG TPA: M50 family metallopeptidase [Acidimicrobiia bacterium]|jgi:membrane-associated protease RseP (regulator of RpoE activity)